MVTALLVAAAALVWPTALPSVPGSVGHAQRWILERRGAARPVIGRAAVAAALLTSAALVAAQWGVAVAIAGLVLGATGWGLSRRIRAGRRRRLALEQIVSAMRMLGRELHAGADPALAARDTAGAATGEGAVVVTELSRAIAVVGSSSAQADPSDSDIAARQGLSALEPRVLAVARLRAGWTLTRRHGVAFTPLIDALAAELAEQLAADSRRAGEVAGPRMSGYVMALLPLLGLLLGAGMGADPVEVLFRTQLGNVLLVVGTALTCGGLLWSARIVAR